MKIPNAVHAFAYTLAVVFLFSACKREPAPEKTIDIDPAFGAYISAFTSGVIGTHDPILVQLAQPAIQNTSAGQALPENALTFNPKIDGVAVWKNAHTIEFIPASALKSGQSYHGNLALNTLMEVAEGYESFKFQFQTVVQDLSLIRRGLEMESENLTPVTFEGVVYTADIVDPDALQKATNATLDGKRFDVKVVSKTDHTSNLSINGIPRGDKESELIVQFDAAPLGMKNPKTYTFKIPSLNDFDLLSSYVSQADEQKITLEFSDPLAKQDLRGLITLEDAKDMRIEQHGNRVDIYSSTPLTGSKLLTIYPAIKNAAGRDFGKEYSETIAFESNKPAIRLTNGKSIIPSQKDGLIFSFDAVSLRAVDVYVSKIFSNNVLQYFQENDLGQVYNLRQIGRDIYRKHVNLRQAGGKDLTKWNRFYLDLSDILNPDKGAFYRVEIRFRQAYSLYPCDGETEISDNAKIITANQDGWISDGTYYDDNYYADFRYDWENREDPCNPAYYSPYQSSEANVVMSTNLGLLAKMGSDKRLLVSVNDIATTKSLPGVQIEVFDYQQQKIGGGITDMNGMFTLECSRKPFVVSASSRGDQSYLKVQEGNALSLSKFNVNGTAVQEGVKGFIYGERGVWRPGDSLYLNFILQDVADVMPENHPVEMKIFDPRGRKVSTTVRTSSKGDFFDFRTATDPEAPTGTYRAEVLVGNRTFSKNLKIETIKPNRLKVELNFDRTRPFDKFIAGTLKAEWLHGAAAPNLGANITMGLWPTTTTFTGFENYHFDNMFLNFGSYVPTEVFEGNLDAQGQKMFKVDMTAKTQNAPGMLEASFETKVQEPGGGFSINYKTLTYSPYDRYAGLNIPKGSRWGGSLETGQPHDIKVVSLNADGKPSDSQYLEAKLYRIDWRWWYDRYDGASLNYLSSASVNEVKSQKVNLTKGKGVWPIQIPDPDWGRYLLVVTDPISGHSAASFAYFDWPYQRRAQRGGSASTILQLIADKETYAPGDSATVSFLSPANGRVLISIENGTEILDAYWIPTSSGSTDVKFAIAEGMSPNVYVHVTVLQPHAQTANDRPMRMYGIIPLEVNDPSTHLEPVLKAPEVLRPEETFTVEVSEKTGRPMTYTLAIVDDGLLDLTGFATPDPHRYFYAPEALGVHTWDFYDEIFGALDVGRSEVMRIGGDERGIDPSKQKARRFKPVVRFVGPVSIAKGQTAKHNIDMPNYIGSVRIMVVAGEDASYGNAELIRPVRSPLMVTATMPRVVGPGERITLPVNVFATEDGVKKADISVKTNTLFEIQGAKSQSVNFDNNGSQTTFFTLTVKNEIGKGEVTVNAKNGGNSSHDRVEIQVRSPNPRYSNVENRVVQPGETWSGRVEYFGIQGTNEAVLELSDIPPINLEEKLEYLIHYPHGCLEQVVSGAFPQFVLGGFIQLSTERKVDIESNIRSVLHRLRNYQTSSGGLSYWPGQPTVDPWSTSYAGHFMLTVEKGGYELPVGLKSQWLRYQKTASRDWLSKSESGQPYSQRIQAYRLYTMALAGQAEMSGMNHLSNVANLDLTARYILALAYAEAGLNDAAINLIKSSVRDIPAYTELSYTYGSNIRDDGFVLLALNKVGFNDYAAEVARRLAENIGKISYLGTQTTAVSLIALADFLGGNYKSGMKATFVSGDQTQSVATAKPIVQLQPDAQGGDGKFSVTNDSETPLFARLIVTGQPLAGKEQNKASNLKMSVSYLNNDLRPLTVSALPLGTDLIAEVTVTNPGTRGDLKNLALTQVFPSGWEILNPRMGMGDLTETAKPDYQDIRDDRVMSYFNLPAQKSITFRIRLNAAYAGQFYLPATTCSAMYDERISAVQSGQWVEVSGSRP